MKCHECGKEMLPDAFGRRVDGSPSMEGFSGYDAGEKTTRARSGLGVLMDTAGRVSADQGQPFRAKPFPTGGPSGNPARKIKRSK